MQITYGYYADEYGGKTIPEQDFRKAERQAEAYIPTQFKSYEEKSREQYFFVKNNYYYLFELAEQVNKRFFQADFCYELKLSTERKAAREIYLDKWRLSVCPNGKFENL